MHDLHAMYLGVWVAPAFMKTFLGWGQDGLYVVHGRDSLHDVNGIAPQHCVALFIRVLWSRWLHDFKQRSNA